MHLVSGKWMNSTQSYECMDDKIIKWRCSNWINISFLKRKKVFMLDGIFTCDIFLLICIENWSQIKRYQTKDDTQNVKNQLKIPFKSNTTQPNFNPIIQILRYIKIFFDQKVVNWFIEIWIGTRDIGLRPPKSVWIVSLMLLSCYQRPQLATGDKIRIGSRKKRKTSNVSCYDGFKRCPHEFWIKNNIDFDDQYFLEKMEQSSIVCPEMNPDEKTWFSMYKIQIILHLYT